MTGKVFSDTMNSEQIMRLHMYVDRESDIFKDIVDGVEAEMQGFSHTAQWDGEISDDINYIVYGEH